LAMSFCHSCQLRYYFLDALEIAFSLYSVFKEQIGLTPVRSKLKAANLINHSASSFQL